MVVFGSGGHTTEMLLMIKNIDFNKYGRITFVIGHSDTWSLTKMKDFFTKNRQIDIEKDISNLTILRLFRSREVKQSYFTSVFTTLLGLLDSIKLIAKLKPDLVRIIDDNCKQIVTNGPGTAVPLCYASFGLQRLLLVKPSSKILFIESFCRVTSLSLSGLLLKPVANKFVVHWEPLLKKHKGAVLFKDKIL